METQFVLEMGPAKPSDHTETEDRAELRSSKGFSNPKTMWDGHGTEHGTAREHAKVHTSAPPVSYYPNYRPPRGSFYDGRVGSRAASTGSLGFAPSTSRTEEQRATPSSTGGKSAPIDVPFFWGTSEPRDDESSVICGSPRSLENIKVVIPPAKPKERCAVDVDSEPSTPSGTQEGDHDLQFQMDGV